MKRKMVALVLIGAIAIIPLTLGGNTPRGDNPHVVTDTACDSTACCTAWLCAWTDESGLIVDSTHRANGRWVGGSPPHEGWTLRARIERKGHTSTHAWTYARTHVFDENGSPQGMTPRAEADFYV